MIRKYAYIWTFVGGFLALTLAMVLDNPVLEVLAGTLAVIALVTTGALWQDERVHYEYEAIFDELREFIE